MTPKSAPLPQSATSAQRQIQRWLKRNLFNGWFNSLLTLVCLVAIAWSTFYVLRWVITQAQWAVISANLRLFFVGRYPVEQIWRVWTALAIVLAMVALWWQAGTWTQKTVQTLTADSSLPSFPSLSSLSLFLILPPIAFFLILWLLAGGLRLPQVGTNLWGGLLLTLVVAIISIVLAFPLGVLLALGRKSSLPILQGFCTVYIELIRGLPLIGVLFMAQVMLPLVLPGQPNIDRVVRAIAGFILFNAAYLAENVRGGLQSVPRGQTEAAKALGFNPFLTLRLVVLPQALQIAIPGIVGQFISLFKDTSLLALFALLELTGIGRSILAQPEFLGRYAEVYLLIGLIYWVFCFTMSRVSQRLEQG